MVIRLHVTDGVDDVAAIAGPPNPLLGIDAGPSVGTVVAPYTAASDSTTQLAVTGHVPVPRPGHVYTVNAVAELTSGCGRNPCASYPAAPPPPAAPGVDLTPLQQTDVCTTTTDTYDGGCQFEFTVAGA
jgi:hypothetical protein